MSDHSPGPFTANPEPRGAALAFMAVALAFPAFGLLFVRVWLC